MAHTMVCPAITLNQYKKIVNDPSSTCMTLWLLQMQDPKQVHRH